MTDAGFEVYSQYKKAIAWQAPREIRFALKATF